MSNHNLDEYRLREELKVMQSMASWPPPVPPGPPDAGPLDTYTEGEGGSVVVALIIGGIVVALILGALLS